MTQMNGKLVRVLAGGSLAAIISLSSMTALAAPHDQSGFACSSPAYMLSQLTGISQKDIDQAQDNGRSGEQTAMKSGKLTQYRQQMLDFKKEILAKLVDSGTITQKQADAILSALQSADSSAITARKQAEDAYSNSTLASTLKSLVSKRIITQKQADGIKDAFAQADRDAKEATQAQNATLAKAQDAIAFLVKAKGMTQAQADEVIKAVNAQAADSSITLVKLQATLNTLVKAKTISSSLASEILDACN